MTNEERNTALYQKMFAEQEVFRDWLKGQSPEKILNHAYEYTVREDILLSLEYHDLSDAQADALMKSPSPLADVFRDFEKLETSHMETVWDCLEGRADTLLEEQRRTLRETPVYELARRFTKGNHAYIVCTHIDKAHIHNHVIWNSTALDEQSKFRNFWGSTKAVRRLNDTICVENGYSIVENPKGKGKTYDKWLGNQKKPSHRERICYAIDDALEQKPQSFEKLLELLRESGYQIKEGKVPSLLGEEQKRFIRMDTLGAGYTPDDLRAIIDGTKAHTPKKKRVMDTQTIPSGSLLIDIQAKLQEGKGAGYARWAKNFNLKQLSQTLIYLEENSLLDRSVLEERTAAVTAQYHTLSAKMKSAEQRMAEIKVLQQHIINYAKTRNTYVAYRKAGYSKRFLLEHESEIILHKAAKQFFDEQGLKKLPTVKNLQAEYAQLLSEKKAMYADYQKAREDMRSLQTAKANVDRILGDNSLTEEIETEKNR